MLKVLWCYFGASGGGLGGKGGPRTLGPGLLLDQAWPLCHMINFGLHAQSLRKQIRWFVGLLQSGYYFPTICLEIVFELFPD